MTTSTKLTHEKDGAQKNDENGNSWETQKIALEKELSNINTLLQKFSNPNSARESKSNPVGSDKNGTNAQLEINLLEKKCICLLKLRKNSEVVKEAYSILAKRSPPSNIVFKCVIIALCRLGQIDDARKVIQQWEKVSANDMIVNDFKEKIEPYLDSAQGSTNPGEVFKSFEHAWNPDWYLSKNTPRNNLWRHRPPPRFASALFMCQHGPERCHFGNNCVGAHNSQELAEWKKRVDMRNKNWESTRGTKPCGGLQYLHDITKRINETTQIRTLLADELPEVKFRCAQSLKITTQKKNCEWKMLVVSKSPVRTVSLLHDVHRNNFWISAAYYHSVSCKTDIDLFLLHEVNGVPKLQVANTFVPAPVILNQMGGWPEWFYYKLEMTFASTVPGSFRQTIMFDFKTDPKLVKHVAVELLPSDEVETEPVIPSVSESPQLPPTRQHTPRDIKCIEEPIARQNGNSNEGKRNSVTDIITRPQPRESPRQMSKFVDLSNLRRDNYIEMMDKFLQCELKSMQEELSKLDGIARLEFTSTYAGQRNYVPTKTYGESILYANLEIAQEISEDTKAGRLLIRSCQKVLLLEVEASNLAVTKPKRYECSITEKMKSTIIISVDAKTVQELNLVAGGSYSFRIQFVLDDRNLKEMRSTLGSISDTQLDILFPDLSNVVNVPAPENVYTGLLEGDYTLNDRQKQAYNFIANVNATNIPPLLLIGPFGTGKTYTLAQCLKKSLTTQEVNPSTSVKILVCTHSNSAADLYIINYLHAWFEEGLRSAKPLRIYYADRLVQTVSHVVKKYCLFTEDGMNFRYPTREEVLEHQIVIVTLSTSTNLLDLGLEQDTFSHIILDEAAQAVETEAIQPLLLAGPRTKIILAGDHMQLSPEVFSSGQNYSGISLIDRMELMYRKSHPCKIILTENYRSHEVILKFASDAFYGGLLHCASLQPSHPKWYPITVFSSHGEDVLPESGSSYYNMTEVFEVADRVEELIRNWPEQWGSYREETAIAVLTAYADQVTRIRAQLRSRSLGFVSVERILNVQGKQFRAVIVSTVRTRNNLKPQRETIDMGFLSNPKLLNTALTRAQSLFAVVGDPVSLCSIGNCRRLWDELITLAATNGSLYGMSQADLKRQLLELEMHVTCSYAPMRGYSPVVEQQAISFENIHTNNAELSMNRRSYELNSFPANRYAEDDGMAGIVDGSELFEASSSGSPYDTEDEKQATEALDKLLFKQVASIWSDSESSPSSISKNPTLSLSSSNIWAPISNNRNVETPGSDKPLSSSLSNIARCNSPSMKLPLETGTNIRNRNIPSTGVEDAQQNGVLDHHIVHNVVESVLESPVTEVGMRSKLEQHLNVNGHEFRPRTAVDEFQRTVMNPSYAYPRNPAPYMVNGNSIHFLRAPMGIPTAYHQYQQVRVPMFGPRIISPYQLQQPYYMPAYGSNYPNPIQPLYTQAFIRNPSPVSTITSSESSEPLNQNDFPSLSESIATKPTLPKIANAPKIKNKKQSPDSSSKKEIATSVSADGGNGENHVAPKKQDNKDGWVQVKSKKSKAKDATPIPSGEEKIEKLVSMGFEKKESIRALQRTNRNLEEAIEWLLTKSSPQAEGK